MYVVPNVSKQTMFMKNGTQRKFIFNIAKGQFDCICIFSVDYVKSV